MCFKARFNNCLGTHHLLSLAGLEMSMHGPVFGDRRADLANDEKALPGDEYTTDDRAAKNGKLPEIKIESSRPCGRAERFLVAP